MVSLRRRCRTAAVTSLLSAMADCDHSTLSHYDEFGLLAFGHWSAKRSDDGGATTAMLANENLFVGGDDRLTGSGYGR